MFPVDVSCFPLPGDEVLHSKDVQGRSPKAVKWETNIICAFPDLSFLPSLCTTQVRRSNYFQLTDSAQD